MRLTTPTMSDETVLDLVISKLVERPATFSELYGACALIGGPSADLDQVEEAIDVLHQVDALKVFKETRFGERMQIFSLKSEARLYLPCEYCGGTGYQADVQRGLCKFCRGNGVYTPTVPRD